MLKIVIFRGILRKLLILWQAVSFAVGIVATIVKHVLPY